MPEELRKQVEVITGDVLVEDDVDKVVEGRDAIVVTLGTRNDLGMTQLLLTIKPHVYEPLHIEHKICTI